MRVKSYLRDKIEGIFADTVNDHLIDGYRQDAASIGHLVRNTLKYEKNTKGFFRFNCERVADDLEPLSRGTFDSYWDAMKCIAKNMPFETYNRRKFHRPLGKDNYVALFHTYKYLGWRAV